jgi:hypothetical protein
MPDSRIIWIVMFLVLGTGCSRDNQPSTSDGGNSTAKAGASANSNSSTGGWTYQSSEHGFSLDLPTVGWKQMRKQRFIADFWCPTQSGSPMLVGITSVKKQTREQFQASISGFKSSLPSDETYLQKVRFEEGQSNSGNPYVYATACQNKTAGINYVFTAASTIWVADKGITVNSIFEGQGQVTSNLFQSTEFNDFQTAAKSICLSVR